MPVYLKQLLVILLAFRAIVAPWTYRPPSSNPTHRNGLVISVRRWPPQRLQRFSSTSKLLRLFRGKDKVVPDCEVPLQRLVARSALPRFCAGAVVLCLSHSLLCLSHSSLAVRLTTFLRC